MKGTKVKESEDFNVREFKTRNTFSAGDIVWMLECSHPRNKFL